MTTPLQNKSRAARLAKNHLLMVGSATPREIAASTRTNRAHVIPALWRLRKKGKARICNAQTGEWGISTKERLKIEKKLAEAKARHLIKYEIAEAVSKAIDNLLHKGVKRSYIRSAFKMGRSRFRLLFKLAV